MIPIPAHMVVNIFADQIPAFDVVHGRDTLGKATAAQEADRFISAVIQPLKDNQANLIPEGAQRDGAKLVHTRDAVSAASNNSGGSIPRQTYIRHGGEVWKLWAVNNWTPHTDIAYCVATRYLDSNGLIT